MQRPAAVRRCGVWPILTVATWLAAAAASAENVPPEPVKVDDGGPTAAELAHAPEPGAESGRADPPAQDSVLRDIGQGVLLPPRVAFEIVMAPVRGSVYVLDRYRVIDWWKRTFFDPTLTYGVYPTVVVDASYGVTVGARAVHRNLLGKDEHAALRVGGGGEYRFVVAGGFRTGHRFGERTQVEAQGRYERRPEDNFYGIGNVSDAEETNFRQRLERGSATLDVRAVDSLHVRGAAALTDIDFEPSTKGTPIDEVYDVNMLTGWTGVRNLYGELELRWDRRRYPTVLDRHHVIDHGELAAVYAGYVHEICCSGPTMSPVPGDYWRYGGDVQTFIRLGAGPRVLVLRGHVDAVTGELDEVAFSQLPKLGGQYLLRGYPRDRFRDRIAALGTIDYEWDLSRYLIASVFGDVRRVARTWQDFDLSGLRFGYGLGVQLHKTNAYLATASIASSIDGGVFFTLAFDPIFNIEPRVEQK